MSPRLPWLCWVAGSRGCAPAQDQGAACPVEGPRGGLGSGRAPTVLVEPGDGHRHPVRAVCPFAGPCRQALRPSGRPVWNATRDSLMAVPCFSSNLGSPGRFSPCRLPAGQAQQGRRPIPWRCAPGAGSGGARSWGRFGQGEAPDRRRAPPSVSKAGGPWASAAGRAASQLENCRLLFRSARRTGGIPNRHSTINRSRRLRRNPPCNPNVIRFALPPGFGGRSIAPSEVN